MKITEFKKLVREEIKKAVKEASTKPTTKVLENKKKPTQKEGILDALKGMLQKKKQEAPKKSNAGKKIVGMDFDGYYIDEDGNRVQQLLGKHQKTKVPYLVKKQGDKYVVYKKDTGKRVGATARNKEALRKYMAALHINAKEGVIGKAIRKVVLQEIKKLKK